MEQEFPLLQSDGTRQSRLSTRRLFESFFGEAKNWSTYSAMLDTLFENVSPKSNDHVLDREIHEYLGDGFVNCMATLISSLVATRECHRLSHRRKDVVHVASQVKNVIASNVYYDYLMTSKMTSDEKSTASISHNRRRDWFEAAFAAYLHHEIQTDFNAGFRKFSEISMNDARVFCVAVIENRKKAP